MSKLIKLTTISAVLLTGAMFAGEADAGHCYRSRCYRSTPSRRLAPRRVNPVPGRGGPGALPRGGFAGRPGGPAGVGGGAQGVGGAGAQGAGATQIVNVPVGATVTLPGARGTQVGEVYLVLSGVRLPLPIKDWNETGVTVALPDMQISGATQAQLEITAPGSNTPEILSIQLQPRPAVLVVQ
jgi:hypothetical protein